MSEPTALFSGRPGSRLGGRYRLEQLVGSGGSAQVWAAEDEALGRRVAVKLVTSGGGEDAGRVGDEARLLARLNHPGLVPVYDAGTDEAGRPWVVMELVVGETLGDALKRGPLSSERTAEIGRVLAEALAYVHGEGLVHRDMKPANVLLGRDGRVRLTDFGIARLVDAAKVTATGLTIGTASYLSPEQVTGAHVGPLADIYSLGLVLLECLTGTREYPGTAVEVALARLNRPPRVPDTLPSGWPGLLRSMTARETGPRPTAHEAAGQLALIAAGGLATTVLPVRPAPVVERTTVLRTPPPAPAVATVVPAAVPVRSGNGFAWALLAFALVVLAVAGYFIYDRNANDPGPTPPAPSVELPQQLRDDLQQLLDEAARVDEAQS